MGLDIYFHKTSRKDYDKFLEDKAKFSKKTDEEKNELRAKEETPYMRFNPKEIGYFRKVNSLVEFFNYYENCEYQEITKAQLEDLKAVTDELADIKPYRRVRHFYGGIYEQIKTALAKLSAEEKTALDIAVKLPDKKKVNFAILDFLKGMGGDFSQIKDKKAKAKAEEDAIRKVKVALGMVKPVEDLDFYYEERYRKTDKEHAEYLFPTTSGFFFGSTDYDGWYWQGVREVNKWVTEVLENLNDEEEIVLMYCWW